MPWIRNVSLADIKTGNHYRPQLDTVLIQIVDPAMVPPVPVAGFLGVHVFEFLDLEADDAFADEFKVTQQQASQIVAILQDALDRNLNVLVHCVAGVCRSGAVCEVGVMMGFDDTNAHRQPNLMVKHHMMRSLGWTYD